MDKEQAKAQLEKLLAQAPRRESFATEEAFEEASLGYRHRAGPSIRTLRSLANPLQPKSPVTEK